jgi:hypothetical protein
LNIRRLSCANLVRLFVMLNECVYIMCDHRIIRVECIEHRLAINSSLHLKRLLLVVLEKLRQQLVSRVLHSNATGLEQIQ